WAAACPRVRASYGRSDARAEGGRLRYGRGNLEDREDRTHLLRARRTRCVPRRRQGVSGPLRQGDRRRSRLAELRLQGDALRRARERAQVQGRRDGLARRRAARVAGEGRGAALE